MNKLKNTKKSAAFDRSSLIINLFREFPNNKFSLKHLASASGGATKEGRLRTREIITELSRSAGRKSTVSAARSVPVRRASYR